VITPNAVKCFAPTAKKVTAFDIVLYSNEGGSTEFATVERIDPGGIFEVAMNSSRYVYFCDGVNEDKLVVDSVSFADGSEWHRLKPH
jgi:hypothetical protein